MENFNDFEKINRNLYKKDGKYFRLFGHSISPNDCWVIAPKMIELVDIDTASGKDVYGGKIIEFEACGTVSRYNDFNRI